MVSAACEAGRLRALVVALAVDDPLLVDHDGGGRVRGAVVDGAADRDTAVAAVTRKPVAPELVTVSAALVSSRRQVALKPPCCTSV